MNLVRMDVIVHPNHQDESSLKVEGQIHTKDGGTVSFQEIFPPEHFKPGFRMVWDFLGDKIERAIKKGAPKPEAIIIEAIQAPETKSFAEEASEKIEIVEKGKL